MQGQGKIRIAIIVLSVLLAVSLLLLAGTLIYNHFSETQPVSATVPDNIITPETDGGKTDTADENGGTSETATLLLHNRNADDNAPFQAENMFPGDSETGYYCVRVSHKGDVVLSFRADIRPGYEKLAEVLCCRIALPENGEVLYDGLMQNMPKPLKYTLSTDESTTSEVCYDITAYLDTSVGNEYMNKDLIADFCWWVEETENLDSSQTGGSFYIYLCLSIASGSLLLLILLLKRRKKEGA